MHHSSASPARYALYFSPESGSPLLQLGNEWLGRDPSTGSSFIPELPNDITESEWREVTRAAARYGFHATLKPPFRLAEGATPADLRLALAAFAEGQSRFVVLSLKVGPIGRFVALTLSAESSEFSNLAADCVRDFDRFRMPPTELETLQRMHDSLMPREREHVRRWGYPYVLDTWKFHMTLTCSLDRERIEVFQKHLSVRFSEACRDPLVVDGISLFEEPEPGKPFQLLERWRFPR